MLLKAPALQNQVVECGPSLLNFLSRSQIGQEGKKKGEKKSKKKQKKSLITCFQV